MSLTILGASVSPFVRKVRIVLEEKGIPYKLEMVSPMQLPEGFRDISPLGRIPVLKDDEAPGDGALPDSSIICGYLERKYPTPALVPADPFAHARALWFEEYADTDFIASAGRGLFFPIVVNQLMGKAPDIELAQTTAREKLPPYLDYFEKNIKGREFFVGNDMTIADIAVASPFCNLKHAGYTLDVKRWPALSNFVERMHARPSFRKCYEEEKPVFHRPVVLAS
jgi:glutathione S-transferase